MKPKRYRLYLHGILVSEFVSKRAVQRWMLRMEDLSLASAAGRGYVVKEIIKKPFTSSPPFDKKI